MAENNFRIGVLGGMGPMAGVRLQELIIRNTPTKKDQEHIEVVCFTNPHIPDRTLSLQTDNGQEYTAKIVGSLKLLERAGVDCILIPCNTAHARFQEIENATDIPILNMVQITLDKIRGLGLKRVGLLASDGAIASGIFSKGNSSRVVLLESDEQKGLMEIIYKIKGGAYSNKNVILQLRQLVDKLQEKGAEKTILGCTELSLYAPYLKEGLIIDPLSELAKTAVNLVYSSGRPHLVHSLPFS